MDAADSAFLEQNPTLQRGSPEAKFRRAERHLEELESLIEAFDREKPYRLALQSQRWPGPPLPAGEEIPHFEIVIRDLQPVPREIGLSLGDFLTNLRASLDHLAWNLVLENGGKPSFKTQFPITVSEPTIQGGVTSEVMKIVESVQPRARATAVKPSEHPLEALRQLVRVDKHRHLPLCIVGMEGITSYHGDGANRQGVKWAEFDPPRPLQNEANICTMAISDVANHMDVDIEISTTIALATEDVTTAEPLDRLCQKLKRATGDVLEKLLPHAGQTP